MKLTKPQKTTLDKLIVEGPVHKSRFDGRVIKALTKMNLVKVSQSGMVETKNNMPKMETARPQGHVCLCGCNEVPTRKKSVFRMGHDAKLKSQIIQAAQNGSTLRVNKRQWAYLSSSSWAKPYIKSHIKCA